MALLLGTFCLDRLSSFSRVSGGRRMEALFERSIVLDGLRHHVSMAPDTPPFAAVQRVAKHL